MPAAISAASFCVIACLLAGPAHAQPAPRIDIAPPFPVDTPVRMRAIEAVCTGIGSEARADPRWATYPLRIEVAGPAGEFLGDALVTITQGEEALASVNCSGPWVLFRLPAGAYGVTAEVEGQMRTGRVNVGGANQARIILRFPPSPAAKR